MCSLHYGILLYCKEYLIHFHSIPVFKITCFHVHFSIININNHCPYVFFAMFSNCRKCFIIYVWWIIFHLFLFSMMNIKVVWCFLIFSNDVIDGIFFYLLIKSKPTLSGKCFLFETLFIKNIFSHNLKVHFSISRCSQ